MKSTQPKPPGPKTRRATLVRLGAPTFHALTCPTCGAEPPYVCDPKPRSAQAHQKRIDAAFRIAYTPEGD